MSITNIPNKAPKNIPIESIIEYAEKKLTHQEIADLLKCDRSNITKRLLVSGYTPNRIVHFNSNKDKLLQFLQSELVNSITPSEIQKIPPYHRIVAFGILEDKLKQMSASTTNINVLNQIVINLDKSIRSEMRSKSTQDVVIDVPHNELKKLTP